MLTSPVSGLLASFQEHYDDLLQFLTRRMSDRQRAADVAQETYLKLVKIDQQAVTVLHARSFIFRVAGNLAVPLSGSWSQDFPTARLSTRRTCP